MPALPLSRTALTGLQRVEIFKNLHLPVIEALAHRVTWRRAKADERIITRDAPDRDVYLVVAGRVQIAAFSVGGKQVTYREMGAGELFGELAAIDGRARSADVIALEESLLASMSTANFLALMFEHKSVCEQVLKRLAGTVREMTDRVFQLSTLGVRNRVHAEVLRLAKNGVITKNEARIDPPPKHGDIANRVSTYREQVTRELSLLAAQGLVVRDGHSLVVKDLATLERMVVEVGRVG